MFPVDKYKYITHTLPDGNIETIALSTYAGKVVKGIAKCEPRDTYNEEKGKDIAAARCEIKVAKKRLKRAQEKKAKAFKELEKILKFYNEECVAYEYDAKQALEEAEANLQNILANL